MRIKAMITALLIGYAYTVFAYPISPMPLRKLVLESKYIVYADVIKIETFETDDRWYDAKAILVIKETLQGKIKSDTIDVYFNINMICPAPAHYEKGTTVLAFLDKEKKGYSTHALSYGSKTLDELEYTIYKERIFEMQKILKIENEQEKSAKTIDWLISCAVNPVTRWEGIYELSPQSDFMSYYDQDNETYERKYVLTENQKSILRDTFFSIKEFDYADIGLIDLVVKENDKELLGYLIKKLKQSDIEKLWYKDFLMVRVAEYSDRDDLKKIVLKIENLNYMDEDREEKANQLAKEFIEKL